MEAVKRFIPGKTGRNTVTAVFLLVIFFLINRVDVSNCVVALVAVAFTWLFLLTLRSRSKVAQIIFGIVWLLFLPNAAYLFTDAGHVVYQWEYVVPASGHTLLIAQYILLELFAVPTFIFSFYPFEIITDRVRIFRERKILWLIVFNLVVGFGIVLGRFEHINSNVIFTDPLHLLILIASIFASAYLLGLVILFGMLCAAIYFLFRRLAIRVIG